MTSTDVLLVHGAGGGSWEWQIWQRVLAAKGFKTHALTLQPHPGDDVASGFEHTTFDSYLRQVHQALEQSKAKIIIGASLGGLLAAETAAFAGPKALVLVAPIPKIGMGKPAPTEPKRWAASADLANTMRALPDADAASVFFAHQNWRDESHHVLAAAYAGRNFDDFSGASLMLLAQNELDLSNAELRRWAGSAAMDVLQIEGASHAGLLLGRHASVAAEAAVHWLCQRL